jgi:hypothetical protein
MPTSGDDQRRDDDPPQFLRSRRLIRRLSAGLVTLLVLANVPVASAHGATATGPLSQSHGLAVVLLGVAVIGVGVVLKRTDRLAPTSALSIVFVGIVVAAFGAILFEGLSPDLEYGASAMPFPRSWYPAIGLSVGAVVAAGSLSGGWLRWPSRPRYTFLGILLGLWISYPYLLPEPASYYHPLGYLIVLSTPLLVGYVVWTDAGDILRAVARDRVARQFGIGVALLMGLFFFSVTGYLSFFLEEEVPHRTNVEVLPAVYQLVSWPTLEVVLPHIPFFLAVSPGQLIIVGTLSALIGVNAALIARHWRAQERAGFTQGTAGSAAIIGTCTCGCCGPIVAKVAVLAAGPSIAAPLYWVFVDNASPLSALFLVGSVVLFTGTLLYSVRSAKGEGQVSSTVPSD